MGEVGEEAGEVAGEEAGEEAMEGAGVLLLREGELVGECQGVEGLCNNPRTITFLRHQFN